MALRKEGPARIFFRSRAFAVARGFDSKLGATDNRKLAQGSQQVQGEAFEQKFEELLPTTFPYDEFTPVPKGKTGADIIQLVKTPSGSLVGKIVQEYKYTQRWQDEWLVKLKADQRAADADLAIIITITPPKDMKSAIDCRDGIWIATPDFAIMLIWMLRLQLLKVHQIRSSKLLDREPCTHLCRSTPNAQPVFMCAKSVLDFSEKMTAL